MDDDGSAETMTDTATLAEGWREVMQLRVSVGRSGLIAIGTDTPRNLLVTGRSLQEAFDAFVQFAHDCEALGKPFDVLKGIRLK
jgi:deoxyhypusine synthase